MITYKTSRSDSDVQGFFNANGICSRIFSGEGQTNLSIDGTGKHESMSDQAADGIVPYIKLKFLRDNGPLRCLDVGTGMGRLVNGFIRHGVDGFGLEGFADLARSAHCPSNKILVGDLSIPITAAELNKAFDLTTSFELIEHIHRSHEDVFLRNLSYLSDFHLCSIHMLDWPGTGTAHCNIKHSCCWFELFRKHNISYELLGKATNTDASSAHKSDAGWHGGKLPSANEEFRQHVKFPEPDQWACSMFVLLDLRSYS